MDKLFNETINYEDFLLSGTGTAALADSIIAAYLGQKSLSLVHSINERIKNSFLTVIMFLRVFGVVLHLKDTRAGRIYYQ